jgi:hypothetical protein
MITEPAKPALRQLGEWLSGGYLATSDDCDATSTDIRVKPVGSMPLVVADGAS